MSDVVIRVENLGKRYRIGEREPYLALRDVLARAISAPLRIFRRQKTPPRNGDACHIWALKDVSFEVRQGEVVGIIGRNGAGKSTLLKILGQVTRPTEGRARVRGRMGSLLDVGTGFHPELTGRENTYLNGAILGMSKREINRKFEEIVAFAEIEKFIDTPVKYYSSGMYVRLAFSVAAHLEPEILLVDEVLAVGDVAFQKKCLGRMGDVAKHGRTIMFVSHSMAAIALLCKSVIVLDKGCIKTIGPSQQAITEYLVGAMDRDTEVYNVEGLPRAVPGLSMQVEFLTLELEGFPGKLVPADTDLCLRMTVRGNRAVSSFRFFLTIYAVDGTPVGSCAGSQIHSIQEGEVAAYRLQLPNPALAPGLYRFALGVGTGDEREGFREFDVADDVLHFEVLPPPGQDGTKSEWERSWGNIRFHKPVTTRCD
ncbi:MAG: ABC transporter ATP-binding protein [Terriglobia bacterium]|jgi:lipopolysaccharide transport system ATP-binding protein